MTKDIFSDGVLVYDRYYCSKPHTPLLVIKRIVLTAVFCVCSMIYLLTEYSFPVNLPVMAAVCAAACVFFSVLFVFVKKRFAIPVFFLITGVVVWQTFEPLVQKLSYFADACMLLVEGRFLYPRSVLFHRGELLDESNPEFVGGVILGTILLCILYSLLTAVCFSGRLVPVPAILVFAALCVPMLLSERLEFSFWLVPALAAFAALCAIRKSYSGGLAVKHSGSGDYRRRIRLEEKSFLSHISSAPFKKRLEMRCNYYSKYFSVGMYCAALTAVCLIIGSSIIPFGGSIDYTQLYDFFTSIGSDAGISQSPFDDGTASNYFAHGGDEQRDMLNIISPGRGEREIIRVDYTGDRPIYLRGDIGIDFNGTSWTTAVGNEPQLWRSSGLKDSYRPCESRVIAALLSATGYGDAASGKDGFPIITASDVNIEYLCSTNVVFLPPYTAEYSFYNTDSFDVYADFAVRVSDDAGSRVNSVQCTALLPSYMSNETFNGDIDGFVLVEQAFESAVCTPNDIYSSVVPEMSGDDILSDYESYVSETYLNVPEEIGDDISEYIQRTLGESIGEIKQRLDSGVISDAQYRYETAYTVAEYLRSNYTYSLDGSNNSRNPVMQFLNDTKRGHCSLYASAMTLIIRQLGIPARYCTGFYVEGDNGSHSVLLREKNLHAWVEVYTGQLGWVTFDPTSSAAYPGRNTVAETEQAVTSEEVAETFDTRHETNAPEKEFSAESSQSTKEEAPIIPDEPDKSDFINNIKLFVMLSVLLLAAATVVIVVLTKLHLLKKSARDRISALKSGESSECARTIYHLMLALLEYRGITPERGELPTDFLRRADTQLGTSLSENVEILAAMEFGGHQVFNEERNILFVQLEQVISKIRPFNFPGNIRVLKIICNCSKKSENL